MGRIAVIVDGGFIRARLKSKNKIKPDADTIYNEILAQLERNFPDDDLFRIFYYDSVVNNDGKLYKNPVDESEISVLEQIDKEYSDTLYANLQKKDYVAFRAGELSFTGWVLANPDETIKKLHSKTGKLSGNDFIMNMTQKGVDLKMGMDIAYLSMKRIVDKLIIISGDSDLIPAIKFAAKEGLNVYLITLGNNVKDSLVEQVDKLY